MTNKEIADNINMLAKLMELHGENPFKIKTYANAYLSLRKIASPLEDLSANDLEKLPNIGKSVSSKIQELINTGSISELKSLKEKTPEGIIELLQIKGLGPKKVDVLWKSLGIESVGELLYACQENRLIELRGFGQKTQENLIKLLNYHLESKGKWLLGHCYDQAIELEALLKNRNPELEISLVGGLKMWNQVVDGIDLLASEAPHLDGIKNLELDENGEYRYENIPLRIQMCTKKEYPFYKFKNTCEDDFFDQLNMTLHWKNEEEIFQFNQLYFIPTERRYGIDVIQEYRNGETDLIDFGDIKGVIHTHSTYSDGINTIEEMAIKARDEGYSYIAITDHSKSATYANGLSIERVEMQWREIDTLNQKLDGIKILKSIESDILNDGHLDYDNDILNGFDFVIASIHSNLKMDEEKATARLIAAIEQPFTHILGHPTGRLLLSREGYPIDHKKIIDACAANNVSIEINASPYRLDIDYRWLQYCMEKNVKISINPDAHSTEAINYIKWGIMTARKGGLKREFCLNYNAVDEFLKILNK